MNIVAVGMILQLARHVEEILTAHWVAGTARLVVQAVQHIGRVVAKHIDQVVTRLGL